MAEPITEDQIKRGYRLHPLAPIYRLNPTTAVKMCASKSEAETMKFVRDNTSIPVPEVYNAYVEEKTGNSVIVMEFVEGQNLDKAWANYTKAEQAHVVAQLRGYVDELRRFRGDFIGSINGTACHDQFFCDDPEGYGPYKTEADFNQGIVKAMRTLGPSGFLDWRCTVFLGAMKGHDIVLTHGDLDPRNILVQGDKVVAILDWELSGYYPEYWEYCKALQRPVWEGAWSRSQAAEMFLQPFHAELAVIWTTNDILY